MKNVRKLAMDIVRREGGFVDDPNDPGGATKHGVSLAFAKRVGLDLDRDGDTDIDDIRAVTPDIAADLFVRYFFRKPGFGKLPGALHDVMFDTSVLFGSGDAARFLQRALVASGLQVEVDGIVGPQTLGAVKTVASKAGDEGLRLLREAILIERAKEHKRRARAMPKLRRFLRGWLNRTARMARDDRTLKEIYSDSMA